MLIRARFLKFAPQRVLPNTLIKIVPGQLSNLSPRPADQSGFCNKYHCDSMITSGVVTRYLILIFLKTIFLIAHTGSEVFVTEWHVDSKPEMETGYSMCSLQHPTDKIWREQGGEDEGVGRGPKASL